MDTDQLLHKQEYRNWENALLWLKRSKSRSPVVSPVNCGLVLGRYGVSPAVGHNVVSMCYCPAGRSCHSAILSLIECLAVVNRPLQIIVSQDPLRQTFLTYSPSPRSSSFPLEERLGCARLLQHTILFHGLHLMSSGIREEMLKVLCF